MKLLVISSAPILYKEDGPHAYAPYAAELQIWAKAAGEIMMCCPVWDRENPLLTSKLSFPLASHYRTADFNFTSLSLLFRALFIMPYNFALIVIAMFHADHIHLRCPGNLGLLACIAQIFFPFKKKSVKYAGNWHPENPDAWTYRLQRKIVSNTLLSKKMKVLVYGEWPCASANILPFYTASYSKNEPMPPAKSTGATRFIFAGMLVGNKKPMYALELIKKLRDAGIDATIDFYGDGPERQKLQKYIQSNNLIKAAVLHGNQPAEVLKDAWKDAHFSVLPSESEGWPKAIAEGMFWGCVPVASRVSCVPFMLDYGKRGVLLDMEIENDVFSLLAIIRDEARYAGMSQNSLKWSRQFTTEAFAADIEKILRS